MFGPPESTVNWPGRRREEGGSELIAQIRVIQVLPVADSWIDEDDVSEHNILHGSNVASLSHVFFVTSRHNTLNQCWFNVGPPSTTLDQR